MKNQNTKIHSNIEIIGDSLNFINTGISNGKTLLAKLSGGVTKLYTSPRLNLNISVPNELSFPIWGVPNSNITANGTVNIIGNAANPNMRGTINLVDISMNDFDFAIKDLVADVNGAILNGSATARSFKAGGITATDLSGNFSLKDYSKFYLSDLSAKAFDGNIKGKLSYDILSSRIGLEMNGCGLNSTKAVEGAAGIKNALTGVLGFNTKLTMQGITDKEIIYGKTHFCVFDAFDDDNSSDNNSEKVNFKIIFTAYGRDNEFYFEAQQNTTWGSWCLSGNNNLKFGNSNYKFKVSEFDCITLPET